MSYGSTSGRLMKTPISLIYYIISLSHIIYIKPDEVYTRVKQHINTLHRTGGQDRTGQGTRIENTLEGVTLQIQKSAESAGALKVYIYLIKDAQLNIKDRAFDSIDY